MDLMAPGVSRNDGPVSCQILSGDRSFIVPCYFGDIFYATFLVLPCCLATSKDGDGGINARRSGRCHREDGSHLLSKDCGRALCPISLTLFHFLASRPLRGAFINGGYSLAQRAI